MQARCAMGVFPVRLWGFCVTFAILPGFLSDATLLLFLGVLELVEQLYSACTLIAGIQDLCRPPNTDDVKIQTIILHSCSPPA